MRTYCTLFDKNYLAKGLAMIESLRRHSREPFRLYILALDDETESTIVALNPGKNDPVQNIWVTNADSWVKGEGLEEFRQTRSHAEWCWTCASAYTAYLMRRHSEVTYLDADLFFFCDPEPVFEEIGKRSIGIIEHRFISEKKHLQATSGRFNVGMVHFKHTFAGRLCLHAWAAQVRDRCDESTCGDQKYLDEWPDIYGDEVCIIQNIGANVAPWNVGNYQVGAGPAVNFQRIIFYHFHEFEYYEQDGFRNLRLTNYELRQEDREFIYKPYIAAIDAANERIESLKIVC